MQIWLRYFLNTDVTVIRSGPLKPVKFGMEIIKMRKYVGL